MNMTKFLLELIELHLLVKSKYSNYRAFQDVRACLVAVGVVSSHFIFTTSASTQLQGQDVAVWITSRGAWHNISLLAGSNRDQATAAAALGAVVLKVILSCCTGSRGYQNNSSTRTHLNTFAKTIMIQITIIDKK